MIMDEVEPFTNFIARFLRSQDRLALEDCEVSIDPLSLQVSELTEATQMIFLAVERCDDDTYEEIQ